MKKTRRSSNSGLFFVVGCVALTAGFFLSGGFAPVAVAQQGGAPEASAAAAVGHEITLDVVVRDRSKAAVTGLGAGDFTVLDNKTPQKIVGFREVENRPGAQQAPAELVVVIDTVNAPFQTVAWERGQLEKLLKENGGELAEPTTLLVLTDNGIKQSQTTRDGLALSKLLDQDIAGLRTINRSMGFYGAVDRYDLSLRAMSQIAQSRVQRPGRKLLLWISPGWPIFLRARETMTQKEVEQAFHSIVALSTTLRQAQMTVYAIDPLGTADAGGTRITIYKDYVKGVSQEWKAEPADLALSVLAEQSGGAVLNSSNDVAGLVREAAGDAESYYELRIEGSGAEKPNEYHAVVVKTDRPGVVARTRTGYYAQPGS